MISSSERVGEEGWKVVSDELRIMQIGAYWDKREVVKPGNGLLEVDQSYL